MLVMGEIIGRIIAAIILFLIVFLLIYLFYSGLAGEYQNIIEWIKHPTSLCCFMIILITMLLTDLD